MDLQTQEAKELRVINSWEQALALVAAQRNEEAEVSPPAIRQLPGRAVMGRRTLLCPPAPTACPPPVARPPRPAVCPPPAVSGACCG